MSLRTTLFGVSSAIALGCLGACFIAPGEIAQSSQNLTCTADQRAFNGACREVCSATASCTDTSMICASIDPDTAVCLEAGTSCSYLGSDTECAGRGGVYEEEDRGTYEVWVEYGSYPPYPYQIDDSSLTSYQDPYFTPYGYQPNVQSDGFGCQGNAQWLSTPALPGVACSETRLVNRCRLSYDEYGEQACVLVMGTTDETVLPSQ